MGVERTGGASGKKLGEQRIERRKGGGVGGEARDFDNAREGTSRVLELVRERVY
jgi:hypothetical protein